MADLGTGTILAFATSAFSANLIDIGGPSQERASIETTHMATATAHSFIPGDLVDGGEVDITFEYNGDDTPPIDQAIEVVTINWGGVGAGFTSSFNAFMTNFTPGAAIEERMTATATLKVDGAVTTV